MDLHLHQRLIHTNFVGEVDGFFAWFWAYHAVLYVKHLRQVTETLCMDSTIERILSSSRNPTLSDDDIRDSIETFIWIVTVGRYAFAVVTSLNIIASMDLYNSVRNALLQRDEGLKLAKRSLYANIVIVLIFIGYYKFFLVSYTSHLVATDFPNFVQFLVVLCEFSILMFSLRLCFLYVVWHYIEALKEYTPWELD